MVSASKLYERACASSASMRFGEFERLVAAFGYRLHRIRGSHRIYKHPLVPAMLNIQPRGGEVKGYQVEEFLAMVEAYGLKVKD